MSQVTPKRKIGTLNDFFRTNSPAPKKSHLMDLDLENSIRDNDIPTKMEGSPNISQISEIEMVTGKLKILELKICISRY